MIMHCGAMQVEVSKPGHGGVTVVVGVKQEWGTVLVLTTAYVDR